MVANWQNRTLWTSDNLDIMRGINSSSVDLIYLIWSRRRCQQAHEGPAPELLPERGLS